MVLLVRMRFVTIYPMWYVLPLLLGMTLVSGDCGPKFGGKCSCGEGQYQEKNEQYIVNCTNAGFNNTSVLQHIPPQTQVLIFTGNNIPELPWNVFGTLNNYSHLRVVDMSNNKIRKIRGKSYHRVGNVQRLILNHNDLSISSTDGSNHHHPRVFSSFVKLMELHLTDAFADNTPDELAADLHDIFVNSNLTELTKLHLEQNEITGFNDPQVFCDLPMLMDLHLGDNLLRKVDFNITCLRHLRFLDLERNRISGFSTGDLEILDSFPAQNRNLVIDLRGNHFLCDCNIANLYAWLQRTQVQVRNKEMLRCHRGLPEGNGGEPIMDLRQIQCAPKRTATDGSETQHKATTVVLGILTVILFALIATVVYMNRKEIMYRLTPVLDTISRKVQYTTIGKQDEAEMDI